MIKKRQLALSKLNTCKMGKGVVFVFAMILYDVFRVFIFNALICFGGYKVLQTYNFS